MKAYDSTAAAAASFARAREHILKARVALGMEACKETYKLSEWPVLSVSDVKINGVVAEKMWVDVITGLGADRMWVNGVRWPSSPAVPKNNAKKGFFAWLVKVWLLRDGRGKA